MMQFKIDATKVIAALREYPQKFFPAAQKGMEKGMQLFITKVVREQMTKRPGLKRQTGTLARANRVITRGWGTKSFLVEGQFGYPNAPYVMVHQIGGTFTSKGKMFAIPLTNEAKGKFPRDWGKDRLWLLTPEHRKGGGPPLLMDNITDKPQYALKRTINIPKRIHIPEEFKRSGYDVIGGSVAAEISKQFQRMKV